MHADITCARAVLTVQNAVAEIDRVLVAVRDARLPGYLLLPADVAEAAVPDGVPLPLPPRVDHTDPEALAEFTEAARRLLANGPAAVLAWLLVHRFDGAGVLAELLATGVAHATTPWAKSLVDESAPGFAGTYAGPPAARSRPARRSRRRPR
jgi:indolepyruvate decarboxylase